VTIHLRPSTLVATAAVTAAALLASTSCADDPRYGEQREALIQDIERQVVETRLELGTDRLDPAILAALRAVPRHEFVPASLRSESYGDHPLPIGSGQTISQPYIVAIMTQLLEASPGDRIYELGTGSGYQAAVLAELGLEVYTVEIVPELAERARDRLRRLGYERVQVKSGDGYLGWPEAAPFDGILVTAAADEIPRPLIEQLAPDGRLVMPVGPPGWGQQLMVLQKATDGSIERRKVMPVRFVPITGPNVR
jgi:protein-L-isoaspartate(D-aspartate) O-methyltransferase